jgi:hypothetical protein
MTFDPSIFDVVEMPEQLNKNTYIVKFSNGDNIIDYLFYSIYKIDNFQKTIHSYQIQLLVGVFLWSLV